MSSPLSNTLLGSNSTESKILTITSETQAWKYLSELKDPHHKLRHDDIAVTDWNHVLLKLEGEDWDSSITPSIFPAFNSIQTLIYRAYAEAKYGDSKARLTNEEKDSLEIVIVVQQGCSLADIKIDLAEIAKVLADKMSKPQIFIATLVLILSIAGGVLYKDYLQTMKEIRLQEISSDKEKALLEHLQNLSQEETERVKLYAKAISQNSLTSAVKEDIEIVHQNLLKASTKADKSSINGISLTEDLSRELLKSKRAKPTPVQINGNFHILNVNWTSDNPTITLQRVEDERIIRATFQPMLLPPASKNIMMKTEWQENPNKTFYGYVNARKNTKGDIITAELVKVDISETQDK